MKHILFLKYKVDHQTITNFIKIANNTIIADYLYIFNLKYFFIFSEYTHRHIQKKNLTRYQLNKINYKHFHLISQYILLKC